MKRPSARVKLRDRPHVALLIETSLASGRDILRGVTRYVREHRPWALYHEPHGLEESVPPWLYRWRGDGIIARLQTPEMAKAVAASGIPVVDVLGVAHKFSFPFVYVDDVAVARLAAEHLIERGLQHFGFFGIAGENWSDRRFEGFCKAIAAQGMLPSSTPVARYDLPRQAMNRRSWERVENHLARWIHALQKPVGIMVCSDQRGPQFLEACRRTGARVPDDVAVIGVDNDEPLCEVCDPPLSSIQAGHVSVGYEAASLLDRLLHGHKAHTSPVLIQPQRAITRLSSDMLATEDAAIAAALRLIREQAHEGLQVDAIAQDVGLSRSVLQRRFRSQLKRSVHQEILATKVKRAYELLLSTTLSMAVVAERAGFKYQEYMGAVLKAHLGRTPAQLRRDRLIP